jgi:hypothetical protein
MNDKKGMLVLNLQTKNQNTMTELKETITTVLNKIDGVNKSKKEIFTDTLNLFLSIRSRINFLQLSWYSNTNVQIYLRYLFQCVFIGVIKNDLEGNSKQRLGNKSI